MESENLLLCGSESHSFSWRSRRAGVYPLHSIYSLVSAVLKLMKLVSAVWISVEVGALEACTHDVITLVVMANRVCWRYLDLMGLHKKYILISKYLKLNLLDSMR